MDCPTPRRSAFRPLVRFGALALFSASTLVPLSAKWVGAWVSAQQLVEPHNLAPAPGLAGNTLRQVIHPTLSGDKARVTLSNAYGQAPLVIRAATVAYAQEGAAIDAKSLQPLTFGGARSVTIQPGASVISDDVALAVQAFQRLSITVHCDAAATPEHVTGHPGSRTTSYLVKGDAVAAATFAEPVLTDHWYFIAAVDVWANKAASAIVVLGDSITDGRGSTTNHNDRWPDNLARRLKANRGTAHIAVLNQGIGGNRILRSGIGPSALQRFDRDVLIPPGVKWLIIAEGINDVGTAVGARTRGETPPSADDVIFAYEQMIRRAQIQGVKVYGATLMPFEGFTSYYTPESEADRQKINAWIRTSGKFDGVIDFDAIARNPENPRRLRADVNGGDHLHPSASGYKIMADAIDLRLFK